MTSGSGHRTDHAPALAGEAPSAARRGRRWRDPNRSRGRGGRGGRLALLGISTALVAAVLGGGVAGAAPATPAGTPALRSTPTAGPVVISSRATSVGHVLIDAQGFSLYNFSGDRFPALTGCLPTNKTTTGIACTTIWTPVLATGPLVGVNGVVKSRLGQINRPGVGAQVTYFGQPLYRFINDTAPGQVTGEDVTSFFGYWRLVSVTGAPAADRASVQLELSSNGPVLSSPAAFGAIRSLYVLSADPPRGSTCTAECSAVWPPLLTNSQPKAGPGVVASGLGVLRRADGSLQVTYFGRPLYLFAFDIGPGAQPNNLTNGENFIDPPALGVWDTVAANGLPNPGPISVTSESKASGPLLATPTTNSGGTTATLYTFSADSTTASACSGLCARIWPPLLTSGPPVAGPGVDATKLGSIQRPDGTFQITYAGRPLYLFAHALDPTTVGNNIAAFGGTFRDVALGAPAT